MARKRYSAEEIIGKLREAEVALAQGESVAQVARRLGVAEPHGFVEAALRGSRSVKQCGSEPPDAGLGRECVDVPAEGLAGREVALHPARQPGLRAPDVELHARRQQMLAEGSHLDRGAPGDVQDEHV